ncbi:MAG TPA: glycosyltransferase, partial [Candidatus Polarisedimenticolia bacterium]|nr:glycosyltransferase [Candidatus Polarisedimenticolia bacterium]
MTRRPRTILYVCDFNAHGGTQTHLLHLLAGLDRSRFAPMLATLNLDRGLAEKLAALDADVVDLGLKGALRPSTWAAALSLSRRARRRADLVHGYLFQGNILAAAVSRLSGVACITSVRNVDAW